MGLFDRIFGALRPRAVTGGTWQTLTGYQPVFRDWRGELYESELIRAAIDARARAVQKLEPVFTGTAHGKLRARMRSGPNEWMTWTTFLYRVSTIWDAATTAYIVPVLDEADEPVGIFPIWPAGAELVRNERDEPFLRFTFASGERAAIELSRVGILPKFQLRDDFVGGGNGALNATMQLLEMQRQGITEGIKNGATFRFMARLKNFSKSEDLAKERKRFNREQLQDGSGGLLLMPNTYEDIRQIDQKPYTVDADQLKIIQENVFNYFGVNEQVLQNAAFGDAWSAYYEGAVEPFAILLSETITRMLFTDREIGAGNTIHFASNRIQYMSNADKLSLIRDAGDRGVMTVNEMRQVLNLAPLPEEVGNRIPTRGEYYDAGNPPTEKTGETGEEDTHDAEE